MARLSQSSRIRHSGPRAPHSRFVLKALPVAVALCFCAYGVADPINPGTVGLPMGGTVTSGNIASQLTADKLTMTQSGTRAVIDWQSFHIGAGKTVEFVQPGASAAVLNRVSATAGMSDIRGALTANGTVLLMNPNGVLFHQGASINVGSLIATSGTVDQTGFESGGSFAISGASSGSVSNQGSITATGAGLVALVAPSVSNQGSIIAAGGRVALSGADRATITLNGGLYEFAVPGGAVGTNATVTNAATGRLEGASLLLSTGDAANLVSGVINLQGVQQATGAVVVNGNTVVLTSDLNATTVSGSSNTIHVQPGGSIQDAVKIAKTGAPGAGALVEVQAGSYTEVPTPTKELVTLNKANLTLSGQAGARLVVPDDPTVNGLLVSANNVTVQGLEIAGPINAPYHVYYRTETGYTTPTNISRGIVVGDGITGFAIRNNNIHDVRNGILIHGRNSTGSVSDNTIENTKSGISVQYTDGSGIEIANNREGPIGNEWGLNLNLNKYPDRNSKPEAPDLAWQQHLRALQTANNGWSVQDQGFKTSNRTNLNVAASASGGKPDSFSNQGSRLTPLDSIQEGVSAVVAGGTIQVGAGTYAGFRVNKSGVTVLGNRGALDKAGSGSSAPVINTCTAWGGSVCSSILIDAENVTVSGFDISNVDGAYGVQVGVIGGARANGATVSYNRIHDVHGISSGDGIRAVAIEPADNVTVKYNLIEDISPTNSAANSWGKTVAGIFARVRAGATSNLAIEDNVVRNISISGATSSEYNGETVYNGAKGIWIGSSEGSPTASGVTIARNQISGVRSNLIAEGVLVNHGRMYGQPASGSTTGLVVSRNAISDVVGEVSSHGIELSGPTPNAQVSQNEVNLATSTVANTAGVYVDARANANSAASTITVSGNSLTGTGYGVDVAGDATVNASGNWWGSTSDSAVLARTRGPVDISPMLLSGADADPAVAGFQGGTSNVAVTALGVQSGNTSRIQEGVNLVSTGGTVNVGAGSFAQATRLDVNKSLTLVGAGEGTTTIDARSISNNYGVNVTASDVTLRDFTVYGPAAFFASAYGIKVSPGGGADARLRNFSISRVTSRGAGKAELDLNGVDGALIDQVTLNGAPVGNDAGSTQGAGLQLTDSANVTVRNSRTLNNAWGGLAIYQANRSYNQQVNNIAIEGSNQFAEANPVYMQDESALQDFGSLSIAGFGYAVRNAGTTDSAQYTWLQTTVQNAYDHAVNLAAPASSYVQGWDGAAVTQRFSVGVGTLAGGGTQAMSVATAIGRSNAGADIDVGPGRYAENLTLASPRNLRFDAAQLQGLTLQAGAAGSGLGGQVTVDGAGGIAIQAPVRLLADTTLATTGSRIELGGDVQNAGSTPQALTLVAGSDGNRGDVSMTTGGSAANPLGRLEVRSNRFTLADTLWVQGYRIDALGDVALSNHTLNAQDAGSSNTLISAGDVTGSTVAAGSVEVLSGGDVQANVTADGTTRVQAVNIGGTIVSKSDVDLQGSGTVAANVTTDGAARVTANDIGGSISSKGDVALQGSGNVAATVSALGAATVTARNVSGTVTANQVSVAATDTVDLNVTAGSSAVLRGDVIRGSVSAPVLAAESSGTVELAVDVGRADVKAAVQAQVTGHADSVGVDAPRASLTGSLGTVENTGQGVIETNGRTVPNRTVQAVLDKVRVIPVIVPPPPALPAVASPPPPAVVHASVDLDALPPTAAGPSARPARAAGRPARPRQVAVTRSTPGQAAELLRQWRGVEIDLAPGR